MFGNRSYDEIENLHRFDLEDEIALFYHSIICIPPGQINDWPQVGFRGIKNNYKEMKENAAGKTVGESVLELPTPKIMENGCTCKSH